MILSYSTQNSYLSEQRKMLIRCDNKEMLIHCEQQCNQSHYRNRYELSLETKIRGQRVDSVIKSTEGQGLVPSTHMVVYNCGLSSKGSKSSSNLCGYQAHIWCRPTCKQNTQADKIVNSEPHHSVFLLCGMQQ